MNVIIELHDGKVLETTFESYNADEVAALLNNRETFVIAIGTAVINKNVIKMIYSAT